MKIIRSNLLGLLVVSSYGEGFSSRSVCKNSHEWVITKQEERWSSKAALTSAAILLSFSVLVEPSDALDMDAFAASQLSSSTSLSSSSPKKMSEDEALCKYGQPGQSTGDACIRAGLPIQRKSGVSAYGSVDRGDFARCRFPYAVVDGKYVQQRICD